MRKALCLFAISVTPMTGCSDRLPTAPANPAPSLDSASAAALLARGARRATVVVPPRGVDAARLGTWGSESASLTIEPGGATLKVFSSNLPAGGCYGAFGDLPRWVPNGAFALPGTFVQLMGAYPGRIEYAARYDGSIDEDRMTLTVTVPSLSRVLGPYRLVYGAGNSWTPCLYP
ncbi:MAG: hypothetical protein LC796_13595 [Acidobacteria bacterium]|nr:hypothetical protein [Acidobacteriota bacterium]MCA1610560.1 hypothetical protein [Acidobacteriota bacterium]